MVIIYAILFLLSAIQKDDDVIIWDSVRKLQYLDFEMNGTGIDMLARSELEMIANHSIRNDTFFYSIYPVFHKKNSFMNEKHPIALLHEQVHFDIMETVARDFRRKLNSNNFPILNKDSVTTCLNSIYDDIMILNRKFDAETATDDLDLSILNKWNDSIQHILNSSHEYTQASAFIVLKKN